MSKGTVNKVILVGNVGADPDFKSLPNGGAVCNISVATTESWKDKQSGQQQESTEWHRVVFFGNLANIAKQIVQKGSQVYVEGKNKTSKWQAEDGTDRFSTSVIGNELQLLRSSPKTDGDNLGGGNPSSAGAEMTNNGLPPAPDYDRSVPDQGYPE